MRLIRLIFKRINRFAIRWKSIILRCKFAVVISIEVAAFCLHTTDNRKSNKAGGV